MSQESSYALTDSERVRLETAERFRTRGAASVPELLGMLTDRSWVVRRAAVGALAAIGEPSVGPLCDLVRNQRDDEARLAAAVDALVVTRAPVESQVLSLSHDDNPAVVADVAQILGRRRSEATVTALAGLTRHPNDNVAVAAIEALGRIGGRAAIEMLIDCTGSGSFFRTFPAIDVLGRSGDPRVVAPLAKLLENPHYLPEAARALGRSGERASVKPLLALLDSSSDAVVRVAITALAELRQRFEEKSGAAAQPIDELIRANVGPEMIRRLARLVSSADVPEAIALCKLLGATGSPESVPVLAPLLDGPPPLAACAAAAIKSFGTQAAALLLEGLREGSSARRRVLLPVLTRASAAPDVAACLEDTDPEVRALACETLARLGNPSVVPQLFHALDDGNLRVVHSATAAIQALSARESRRLAVAAARSPNPIVRRSALRILAYFGDDAALEPMLNGLEDADARVREAALQGLPYLADKRALEALYESVKSTDARTRAIAARSLGHIVNVNERVYSLLLRGLADPDAWVRYYACQSLGRLAYGPAAAPIAKLLEDEAGQVRVSAVESLSHLESPQAHQALRDAAAAKDLDVRRAALVGLGIAHRAEDLPVILAAAHDSDTPTRLMALAAMANFAEPTVLGALSAASSDPEEQVRSAAIGFLASRPEQEATEVLIELLGSGADSTRERARGALLLPSEGRIAGLLTALESARDELAPMLIATLARIERPEGRVALLSTIKLHNVAARKAAAVALAARRDPETLALLREAADNDPEPDVRQICGLLLGG